MNRRSAATLVEVLVAIFVTAIGLLALLALFPLGALSMAQAIKDGRSGLLAGNAERTAEALNVRQDNQVVVNQSFAPFSYFENPNTPGTSFPPANPYGPGYPVFVDPIGYQAFTGLSGWTNWVAGTTAIPRRSVDFINNLPAGARQLQTLAWFTLTDDISFLRPDPAKPANDIFGGLPCTPPPAGVSALNSFEREGRYSCAYMLTRPSSSDAKAVNLTVVVYSQRPLQLTGSFVPVGEELYAATGPGQIGGTKGSTVLTIYWPATAPVPSIRRGAWILDASREEQVVGVGVPNTGWAHSSFYRVVGYTQTSPNTMDLELQTPLDNNIGYVWPPPATGAPGQIPQIVIMENVVEVFPKGAGWPSPPSQ